MEAMASLWEGGGLALIYSDIVGSMRTMTLHLFSK